ncbi:hypothetical protein EDB92DRAFT_1944442 [Lactarius akahatsu]|uniref:Uncharacterized protein n=1 Tax=Lactarius akahatsu TaxID=416441 RepID=A0AAD4LI75_9AGAM|nr:hypothetical protein EDB92DRAFT_1944442 [Lactarius akahatsu]
MAARPLPGATYHTVDFAFHSSPDADPEAVDSYGPSEKEPSTLESRIHLPIQTSHDKARTRRGPPVLLILLLLCCLAFVVSAFTGSAFDDDDDDDLLLSCVPERLAPLAQQISAEFQTAPHAERVYVTQERALDILKQKHNTSRVGCHATNVRDYMRRSYPVVESSLDWTNVSQSAIVLRWQGADPKLKPRVFTNDPEVLGPEQEPARAFQCEDKAIEDEADVQSAVGLLTAVERLVQSGYQPSRTHILSVMLGEAADVQKLSQYLHATYGKHGVDMGRKPPPPPWCRSGRLPKMLDALLAFYDRLYWRVSALFAGKPVLHCLPADYGEHQDTACGFDESVETNLLSIADEPLFIRYVRPTGDEAASRKRLTNEVSVWMHAILEAGQ